MKLAAIVVAVMLSGCGVHSVHNISDRESVDVYAKAQPHNDTVFVTKEGLRPGTYENLAQINVSRNTCEGDRQVMQVMADQARQHGCDAVIEVDIWRKPSGWCRNSPHANGQCVRLLDKSIVQQLDGFWF